MHSALPNLSHHCISRQNFVNEIKQQVKRLSSALYKNKLVPIILHTLLKMEKLAVFLLAVFAYNALATPINTVIGDEIKTKVEKVRDETIDSIDTLNLDNVDRRRAIVSHSSEFAQKVQEAVNKIFRTFVRVDERDSHRILPQSALRLNDIVHEVQEVLITKPTILRRTLKENVRKVGAEAIKLIEILQHFTENKDEGKLRHDVKDIVDKLIDAIHQLRVRSNMHHQTHEINVRTHQNLGNEIITTLNKITWYDRNTLELLSRAAKSFDRTLNHILHHFQNEVSHFEGKERNDFDEVVRHLQETHAQLNALMRKNDYSDVNRKIDDLKTQLRLTVHNVDVQIQRLVKIGKVLSGDRTVVMDNCIRNIAADSMHGEQRVLWKLQDILRTHHVLITVI